MGYAIQLDATARTAPADPEVEPPVVLPMWKPRPTRRVGVVKSCSPCRTFGVVEGAGGQGAIFTLDDVAAEDRDKIDCGLTVTFQAAPGPDGLTAKDVRLDATSLPPPPDDMRIFKGWR